MNNISILRKQNDLNRLLINEAILMKLEKPEINRQDTGVSRTLKLFSENVIPQNILQLNYFRPDRNLTQITNGNNIIRIVWILVILTGYWTQKSLTYAFIFIIAS